MIAPHRLGLPGPASQPPGRLLVIAACLVPLLAACTNVSGRVHLPAKTPVTTAASVAGPGPGPGPGPLTLRQQVIAAYTDYSAAMAAAFASRSPGTVSRLLRPYLDAATIAHAIRAFSRAWARDEVSYGQIVRHIIGVRILGTAAWVHDCDDTGGSGLEYASSGQLVLGTLGIPDENIVTRLNLVHGRWVVLVQTIEDLPCTP